MDAVAARPADVLFLQSYDFSDDGWDLSKIITDNWPQNANYHGMQFKIDSTTHADYGMTATTKPRSPTASAQQILHPR